MKCPKCGNEIYDGRFCPYCGTEIITYYNHASTSARSGIALLILWLFLGGIGAHRFYAGKIGSGILMAILTISMWGTPIVAIWLIIDLILICCGNFTDSEGYPIKF